jgi:hypothetical protein
MRPATKRNSVQALHYDNIYAVSIILLLVATVESYVTRLRYFKGSEGEKKKASVPRYLMTLPPETEPLQS